MLHVFNLEALFQPWVAGQEYCFSTGVLFQPLGIVLALGHYSIFGSSGIVPALDCFAKPRGHGPMSAHHLFFPFL